MLPVPFDGSRPIAKPATMTDEQCSSLEVMDGVDGMGVPFYVSCWQLSKEDIEAVNAGRPVWLKVCGIAHPPVALFTCDADGVLNQ